MAEKKLPLYTQHECGLLMSAGFNPDHFSSALIYEPLEDDVFICTYPKCGTTWMQNILYLMRNGGQPLQAGENINVFVPHIESDGADSVRALKQPRIIKTHLPYNLVPKSKKARYIYIARNPKDCCVSFFHHTKGFPHHYDFADGTFDDFFDLFVSGRVDYNDYFDHLLSYVSHRNDPNALFLLYEELRGNTRECLLRIAAFLGGPFGECTKDEAMLERVLVHSSLREMKTKQSRWCSERPPDAEPFVREGSVGGWQKIMSPEQCRLLDERIREKLGNTEAENLWDAYKCM